MNFHLFTAQNFKVLDRQSTGNRTSTLQIVCTLFQHRLEMTSTTGKYSEVLRMGERETTICQEQQGAHRRRGISVDLGRMGKIHTFLSGRIQVKVVHRLIQTRDLGAALHFFFSLSCGCDQVLTLMLPSLMVFLPGSRLISRSTGIASYLDLHLLPLIPSAQATLTTVAVIDYLFASVMLKKCLSFNIIYTI